MLLNTVIKLLSVILIYNLAKVVFILFERIKLHFQDGLKNIKENSTIFITGATNGIGKSYAIQFARQNTAYHLILLGRSEEKLDNLANELKAMNQKLTITLLNNDLTAFDENKFSNAISNIPPIDILINNAGLSYDAPSYLTELSTDQIKNIINTNLTAPIIITKLILAHNKTQHIKILNCGSGVVELEEPLLAVYCASKSGLKTFSSSLRAELPKNFAYIQYQNPLFVSTKMSKIKKTSLFVPSPDTYAKASLNCFLNSTKSFFNPSNINFSPYLPHTTILFIASNLIPHQLWALYRYYDQLQKKNQYEKKRLARQPIN